MKRCVAVATALLLWSAGFTTAKSADQSVQIPCGEVTLFVLPSGHLLKDDIATETVTAHMTFIHGTTGDFNFPYPWVYKNPAKTDPFYSVENSKIVPVRIQPPPLGFDSARLPPPIDAILRNEGADGQPHFNACPPALRPSDVLKRLGTMPFAIYADRSILDFTGMNFAHETIPDQIWRLCIHGENTGGKAIRGFTYDVDFFGRDDALLESQEITSTHEVAPGTLSGVPHPYDERPADCIVIGHGELPDLIAKVDHMRFNIRQIEYTDGHSVTWPALK